MKFRIPFSAKLQKDAGYFSKKTIQFIRIIPCHMPEDTIRHSNYCDILNISQFYHNHGQIFNQLNPFHTHEHYLPKHSSIPLLYAIKANVFPVNHFLQVF